jgi:hypothetical protein
VVARSRSSSRARSPGLTIELKDVKTAEHREAEQARNLTTLKKALSD